MNGIWLLRLLINIIICIVLQICTNRTQSIRTLTTYITIHIVCLAINGFSLVGAIISCLIMNVSLSSLLTMPDLVVMGLVIWQILLLIGASKQKEKLEREDTVQVVYCSECGMASPDGALFCRKCGKKLEKKENVV